MVTLQRKLAFLHPSDFACIPFSTYSLRQADGCLLFRVVFPKETRNRRKIIKPFTIHPHATEICPVRCFSALHDHPGLTNRPADSLLFVKSSIVRQPISASTISSWLHRDFIALSTSESRVSIRSLASSAAMDNGVDLQDIVSLGNWASATTFKNHYQRDHMAQVEFTSTMLSSMVLEDEFYDANESLD